MKKISSVKIGGTSYPVSGSGGGNLYDAVIKNDDDTGKLSLQSGDFQSCYEKILNGEFVNIVVFESSTDDHNRAGIYVLPIAGFTAQNELISIGCVLNGPTVTILWTSDGLHFEDGESDDSGSSDSGDDGGYK